MTKVLALDLSKTNTGYALFEDGNLAETGQVTFKDKVAGKELFEAFKDWFVQRAADIDHVVYESAKPRNMKHSAIHFGFIAIIELAMKKGRVHGVSWSAAKKALTGDGRATKDDMLNQAKDLYPMFYVETHDIADAIGVGLAWFGDQPDPVPF